MKSEEKNELWEVDARLFESIKDKYQSENEKQFFEKVYEKQLWDCAVIGDLLMSEKDNEDSLFIVRINYEEYKVSRLGEGFVKQHVMNLSEALAINLKDSGFITQDLTLFQWLRLRDYNGIKYDANYDYV